MIVDAQQFSTVYLVKWQIFTVQPSVGPDKFTFASICPVLYALTDHISFAQSFMLSMQKVKSKVKLFSIKFEIPVGTADGLG